MGMPLSFPSRTLGCSPVYLEQSGDHGSTYQGEVSVLGRLDMCRTTAARQSCFAGALTSLSHRSSRYATRTSTVHVLHRITLVSAHADLAPACICLAWEARVPTRGTLQPMAQWPGVW